jgi:hypothetical protein
LLEKWKGAASKRRDEKGEAFFSLELSVLSRCPRGLLRRRRLALSGVKGGEGNETKRPRQGEHDETDEEEQQSDGWLCRKRGKRKKKRHVALAPRFLVFLPSCTHRANSGVAESDKLSLGSEFFTKGLIVAAIIRGHSGSDVRSVSLFFFWRSFFRPTRVMKRKRGARVAFELFLYFRRRWVCSFSTARARRR